MKTSKTSSIVATAIVLIAVAAILFAARPYINDWLYQRCLAHADDVRKDEPKFNGLYEKYQYERSGGHLKSDSIRAECKRRFDRLSR